MALSLQVFEFVHCINPASCLPLDPRGWSINMCCLLSSSNSSRDLLHWKVLVSKSMDIAAVCGDVFSKSWSQSRTLQPIENHRCGRLWLDDIQGFFFRAWQVHHKKLAESVKVIIFHLLPPPKKKRSLWMSFHDLFMNLQNLIQCGFQKGGFTTCLGWFLRTYNDPQTLYLLFEAALGGGKTPEKKGIHRCCQWVTSRVFGTGIPLKEFQKNPMRSLIQWRFSVWEYYSRWWFQIFFIFTPIWGRFPFWLICFKWAETTT